jgi:hypothetical protein
MAKFSNIIKDVKANPNFSKVGGLAQDLVDGNILMRKSFRRQYLLVFLIAGLCILYIGNRYTCDKAVRRQRELVKEIEDRRFELLSISAQLTERNRGSVVEDSVRAHLPELVVSRVPSIIVEEQDK